jgi:hypothetical protein
MDVVCSTEMFVPTYQTVWCYNLDYNPNETVFESELCHFTDFGIRCAEPLSSITGEYEK